MFQEAIVLVSVAGVGYLIGSVNIRRQQFTCPETRAQAYRDIFDAMGRLVSIYSEMFLAFEGVSEAMKIARSEAFSDIDRAITSAAFMLPDRFLNHIRSWRDNEFLEDFAGRQDELRKVLKELTAYACEDVYTGSRKQ
jgi:hypothetical protein